MKDNKFAFKYVVNTPIIVELFIVQLLYLWISMVNKRILIGL